jgi:hypothetical protein
LMLDVQFRSLNMVMILGRRPKAMYDNNVWQQDIHAIFFLLPLISNSILVLLALLKLKSMIQKTIFLRNWHKVKVFARVVYSRMSCPCFITFMWTLKYASCPSFGGTCKKPSFQIYHLLHANSWYHRSQIKIKHIFNIKWVLTSIQRWKLEMET